jgi:hypothetical protein
MKTTSRMLTCAFAFATAHHILSCGAETDPGTDTNTNWVRECTTDARCGEGTSCECELCTVGCDVDADCSEMAPDAVCLPDPSNCASAARICLPPDMDFIDEGASSDDDAAVDPRDSDAGGSDNDTDGGVGDDDVDTGVWSARPTWSTFDFERAGEALIVDPDGSIYVTGGQGRSSFDLSVVFENFWVARFSSAGEPQWEQIVPIADGNQSNGLGIALSSDGTITTVATLYDGNDTPLFQRYDSMGMLLGEFSLAPGIKWLATSPSGELVGAGLNLIEYRDGRPYTELWVGGISEERITWQKTLRGVDGSSSFAWDLAVTAESVFVAGSQGTASDSNASNAWLGAGPLGSAEFDWELVPATGGGTGRTDTIALVPEGGVVVAGYGDLPFVHRYHADGNRVWERALDLRPSAIIATDAGYVIGYDFDGSDVDSTSARIEFFDWDGVLVWRFEDSSCERVNDLVVDGPSLVALLSCNDSLGLFRIPVDQAGAALGGVGIGVASLRACTSDMDCESGHSCQSGTCAQDCTGITQCQTGYGCVSEHSDQGVCPYLGPGEPGTPGVCLPRCFAHTDCSGFAPGLSCVNNSCVLQVPECESRCYTLYDGCAEGCAEIGGRGVTAELACFPAEETLLGCYPEGRISTDDDGCVKSASGVVYSAGGLAGATLVRNFGFSECTEADLELLSNASSCEQ